MRTTKYIFLLLILTLIGCTNDREWQPQEIEYRDSIVTKETSIHIDFQTTSGGSAIDSIVALCCEDPTMTNAQSAKIIEEHAVFENLQHEQTYYISYQFYPTYLQPNHINIQEVQTINYALPMVTTLPATDIQSQKATLNAIVSQGDSYEITERGFYYSLLPNGGDYERYKVVCGNGDGNFSATLEKLRAGNIYYFWAYAINRNGIALGEQLTFKAE